MIDRCLKKLGEILSDDDTRRTILRRIGKCIRFFLTVLTISYLVFLIGGMLCLSLIGERNLTFAFLLFVPRSILILPGIFILPVVALFHWKASLPLMAGMLWFFLSGLGFKLRPEPSPVTSIPGETLTVLTYNRGQHGNHSLQPFKNQTDPDIICLEECGNRAALYAKAPGYEKYPYTIDTGEFTVLSRYPVLSSKSVTVPHGHQTHPPAARFEIDFQGTPIALYCVHVISPRDTLLYYRRGAFLYGILGLPGTPWNAKRISNQEFWDDRIEQARDLAKTMADDPLPTIVVGDFNAPAGGYIHRIFKNKFADAHQKSGHGFGYTFPGSTRNPLSLGGPWARIDYLFCGENWKAKWCITEKERPSQHRAVTAQFELRDRP